MIIKNFLNAFSVVQQLKGLYWFVCSQIILGVCSILMPKFMYKITIILTTSGIYLVVMVVRPHKIVSILKKGSPTLDSTSSLEAKVISLIFIVVGSIIIGYM